MKWLVTISALPDRSQAFASDAKSSMEALREVLGREMVAEALAHRPVAALCISVMHGKAKKENTDATQRVPTSGEGLKLS